MVDSTWSALQATPCRRATLRGAAPDVARRLLGTYLVHHLHGTSGSLCVAGMVVETEAYDQSDAASHSCRGRTPRNAVMFGPPGHAYVYRSYGLHWCLNVVCGPVGHGAAVLLRSLQPVCGLQQMSALRGAAIPELRLCRGPGCLTQALGLTHAHNGVDLLDPASPLLLMRGKRRARGIEIVATPRIGISRAIDTPWRFVLAPSRYASGPRLALSASPAP